MQDTDRRSEQGMADWANFPTDLLHSVKRCLGFGDLNRFGAVCPNWRSVAKEKETNESRMVPQVPWMVLGEDPETKKRNFYDLMGQRPYSIDIPELYGQHVCGSSFGWLFTVDIELKCRMVNPYTREVTDLPPLPPYFDDIDFGYPPEEMQKVIISKAVLSHDPKERSDFTVMILFGWRYLLAIWRPGDKSWSEVKMSYIHSDSFDPVLSDVICFRGQFFAASFGRAFFSIDVGSRPKMKRIKPRIPFCMYRSERYLVDFKGELLLVMRFPKRSETKPKKRFRVLSLNQNSNKWKEVESVDELALFVGNNSAVVVHTMERCVRNGIYFADLCHTRQWERLGHQVGVYDMVGEKLGPFPLIDDAFLPTDARLIWVNRPHSL